METWLPKTLGQLNKPSLAVMDIPNLSLLSATAAQQEKHDHHNGMWDMHLWLDPDVMIAFTAALRDELVLRDMSHARQFQENADVLMRDIQQAKRDAQQLLMPVNGVPLLVLHDAWRYFFRVFGLTQGALLQKSPDQSAGMVSLAGLERQLMSGALRCVLREPQFEPKVLVWVKQLAPDIQEVLADPLGYPRYEGGYAAWLLAQANAISVCRRQR
jgi:zinc transport system substrate-binding protein